MRIKKSKSYISRLKKYTFGDSIYCNCKTELSIDLDKLAGLVYKEDKILASSKGYRLRCPKCFNIKDVRI